MISAISDKTSLLATAAAPAATAPRGGAPTYFQVAQALGRPMASDDPGLRDVAAAQLVSELFFTPLLAEMRKFPFGRELATGGQTESAFGQKLDQRIADTVAQRSPGVTRQVMRYFDPPPTGQSVDARGAA